MDGIGWTLRCHKRTLGGVLVMMGPIKLLAVLTAAIAVSACTGVFSSRGSAGSSYWPGVGPDIQKDGATFRPLCGPVRHRGEARCFSWIRLDRMVADPDMTLHSIPSQVGYTPQDLQSAYKLPDIGGRGQVVAIVDAYGYPTAAADLQYYREAAGLPRCAYGTRTKSCFRIVNEDGKPSPLPGIGNDWRGEQALDLDAVSGTCPHCRIILIQTQNQRFSSLRKGVRTALAMGATVVSNSYGIDEKAYAPHFAPGPFQGKGHVIVASAGDEGGGLLDGGGSELPCAFQQVVCAGGTDLQRSGSSWTETVWNTLDILSCTYGSCGGTSSGCSAYIAKPSWQVGGTSCKRREDADVAAVASPLRGYAVYSDAFYGWAMIGGTSLSAPVIAGIYGQAGNASQQNGASHLWAHHHGLFDVKLGTNVFLPVTGPCASSVPKTCTAGPGYDGPSGWGSPRGLSAF
jgi:Subtilase family